MKVQKILDGGIYGLFAMNVGFCVRYLMLRQWLFAFSHATWCLGMGAIIGLTFINRNTTRDVNLAYQETRRAIQDLDGVLASARCERCGRPVFGPGAGE